MRKKIYYSLFVILYILVISISFIGASKGFEKEGFFSIDKSSYGNQSFTLSQENMIVTIELDVYLGELSVYLMNDTEYTKYSNSQPFSAYHIYENVENCSVSLNFHNKENLNLVLVNNDVLHSVPFYLKLVVDTEPLLDPLIKNLFSTIWLIFMPILLLTIFIIRVIRFKRILKVRTLKSIKFVSRKSIEDILAIFGIKTKEGYLVWLALGYFSTLFFMFTPLKYFNILDQNFVLVIIDLGIVLLLYIVATILSVILFPAFVYEFLAGTSYHYNLLLDSLSMFAPIILASFLIHNFENKSPEHPIFQKEGSIDEKSSIAFGNYSFKALRQQKQIWSKINISDIDKSLNSAIMHQLMNMFPGSSIKLEELTKNVEDLVKEMNLTTDQIYTRIKIFTNSINYFKYDYDTNSVLRIELTGEMGFNHVEWKENEDNSHSYLIDPYISNKKNYLLFIIIVLVSSLVYFGLGLFYVDMTFQSIDYLSIALIISYTFLVFQFILSFNFYKESAIAFTDKSKVNVLYKIIVFVFFLITLILINLDAIYGFIFNEMTLSLRKLMTFFIIDIIELMISRILISFVITYFNLKVGHQHFNITKENKVLLIDRKYFSFTRHKDQIQTNKIVKLLVVDEVIKDYIYHKAETKDNKMSLKERRAHRYHLYAIMDDQTQKLILTTRIYRILLNVKNKIIEINSK